MVDWFTCQCDVVDEVDGLVSYNCSNRNLTQIPSCLQTAVRSMYAHLVIATSIIIQLTCSSLSSDLSYNHLTSIDTSLRRFRTLESLFVLLAASLL